MTAGLPGAGIGGLFYLASTLLLPVRSLTTRLRGRPDPLSARQLAHSVAIAVGIIGGLWLAGWLLAFVAPDEVLAGAMSRHTGLLPGRSVVPVATFAIGVATLMVVLVAVEVAHHVLARQTFPVRARLKGPQP
jgi:hypothetical protein